MMDEWGYLSATYRYDPYGRTIAQTGPMASTNRYRFSSKEHHEATGLYYYGYRFYSPNLQRWLNRDPVAENGGIYLYGFVGNNSILYIDPFGLSFLDRIQGALDVWGTFEPTPFCDLTNVLISCGRGNFGDAGYSLLGVVPYVGDLGKVCKYAGKVKKAVNAPKKGGKNRSTRPDPDPNANGPHTIIEKPGPNGQYTTHNGDGTFKQNRGSGKDHGDVPRPNEKENSVNVNPKTGEQFPGKTTVRPPRPDEIPK
jgi:RHS repeat-associated protein